MTKLLFVMALTFMIVIAKELKEQTISNGDNTVSAKFSSYLHPRTGKPYIQAVVNVNKGGTGFKNGVVACFEIGEKDGFETGTRTALIFTMDKKEKQI